MKPSIHSSEGGFTIQELLVALIVGSLVLSFSFSLFLFAGKLLTSWQREMELRTVVNRVTRTIASDVLRSKSGLIFADSLLILTGTGGREIRYRFQKGKIQRNLDLIHSKDVSVTALVHVPGFQLDAKQFLVQVAVRGERGNLSHNSETVVSLPWSSRDEFRRTQGRF